LVTQRSTLPSDGLVDRSTGVTAVNLQRFRALVQPEHLLASRKRNQKERGDRDPEVPSK
jgi:hypothetical protein